MNLLGMSIRRPIAVAMLFFVIAALGIYFIQKLPLETLPTTNLPRLSITASWPYTSAETVEAFLTSPIEGIVQTVKGVREVNSTSSEGSASISAQFAKGTDMDFAVLELNEKLSVLKSELPKGTSVPEVKNYATTSSARGFTRPPPLRYTLTGDYTLPWMRQFAIDRLRVPLVAIDGVGDVRISGGQERVLKIEIDPVKAEMYGIQEGSVNSAIRSLEEKRNIASLLRSGTKYDVYIENNAESVDEIGDLVVRKIGGTFILLKDIATLIDGYQEPRDYHRINGNSRVGITIEHEDGANIIEFVETVDAKIQELNNEFPPNLHIIQENDPSTSIQNDLDSIKARGIFCILVIFAVLYIFIRNVKVPLVIMTTVAFSVLITVIFFYAVGIGFNVMTIAGIALAFGMLVDSSIVVIDNIFRYRERGNSPFDSAEKGAREVFLPIIASVLTTSIVFIPFLYLQGDNRVIYIPLAVAVAFSLISSILVAFTLIPTYSVKVFPSSAETIRESVRKNRILQYIIGLYERFIEYVIHHKYWTLGTVAAVFVLSWFVFTFTVPSYNYGSVGSQPSYISASVSLPQGSVLDRANDIAISFEEKVLYREGVRKVTTDVSPTRMSMNIQFTDEALETAFPYELKDELTSYASTFAGVSVRVSGVGDYFSTGGIGGSYSVASFRVYIRGYNYNKVGEIAEDLGIQFGQIPRVKNVDTNYGGYKDRFDTIIRIKRDALSTYNLSVSTVISIINRYARRSSIGTSSINVQDKLVRYAVKIKDFEELQLEDLKNVIISTPGGEQVRLTQIVEFDEQRVMGSIERFEQQYERIVGLEYRGPTQKGRDAVDAIIEGKAYPNGYTVKEGRFSSYMPMSLRQKLNKWLAILFAVVLVYMVTSSLYESLLHPFVIILTVPMALIGVFLIFFIMGKTFTDAAYVGVILLAGIVVNNSIILVDHINLLRKGGMDLYAAVIQGCKDRVRPILMTSATTIMGMLPLVANLWFFHQSRAYDQQIWYSLALASIGGLITATPLTLSVIPVLYILFEEWRMGIRGHLREI